jgi:hypothetical protein
VGKKSVGSDVERKTTDTYIVAIKCRFIEKP